MFNKFKDKIIRIMDFDKPAFNESRYVFGSQAKINEINEIEKQKGTCNRIIGVQDWWMEFCDDCGNVVVLNKSGNVLKRITTNNSIVKSNREFKKEYLNHKLKLNNTVSDEFLQYVRIHPFYLKNRNVEHCYFTEIKTKKQKLEEKREDEFNQLIQKKVDEELAKRNGWNIDK